MKLSDSRLEFILQDEIRRSEESRYNHRLHAILLIANGMKCPEVSALLGDPERTIRRWIHRFNLYGFKGLIEVDHLGRPPRLPAAQMEKVSRILQRRPEDFGYRVKKWNGKFLSEYIRKEFGIRLGIRQCQRLYRLYGSNRSKPTAIL